MEVSVIEPFILSSISFHVTRSRMISIVSVCSPQDYLLLYYIINYGVVFDLIFIL